MAIPSPTSVNSIAVDQLRTLFARSATLQAETGGSEAAAKNHIYFGATPSIEDQSTFPRPLFVVGLTEDFRYHMIAGGERNQLRPHGTLAFYGIRNTPSQYVTANSCDYPAAEINHMNFFGGVLDDIAALAGWDDNLSVTDIEMKTFGEVEPSYWSELGRFYFCTGAIYWGDRSYRGGH